MARKADSESSQNKKNYYSIGKRFPDSDYCLWEKHKEATNHPKERIYTSKNNNISFVVPCIDTEGYLKDVSIVHKEEHNITSLVITIAMSLAPDSEEDILECGVSSKFATQILNSLENIDLNKKVLLKPYDFEDKKTKEKKKGITISQGGKKVEWHFGSIKGTNGEWVQLNGTPQMKEKKDPMTGKITWDDYDLKVFYKKYLEEKFKPKLTAFWAGGSEKDYQQQDTTLSSTPTEESPYVEDDDLPF